MLSCSTHRERKETNINMSSFFPSPVDERSSPISAAPAPAPALESGEFIGKRSGSNSVKLNHGISAFGLGICSLF